MEISNQSLLIIIFLLFFFNQIQINSIKNVIENFNAKSKN
jgi:hypothetical protein